MIDAEEWTEGDLHFTESQRQEYGTNNCVFSAGHVEGAGIDTVYLKWIKDGDKGGMLLLTPDELQAIAWVASGTVWSVLLGQRIENEHTDTN